MELSQLKKIPIFVTAALLLGLGIRLPIAATGDLDAGFSVSAVKPGNQIDQEAGYFDLLVEPGQEQDLVVRVHNPNAYEITVTVEAVTASTNRNGIINYSGPGIYDETLRNSFDQLARIDKPEVVIPPHATQNLAVSVTIPEEPFDGLMLGAIRVVRLPEEEDEMEGVINQYSYAIGVRLWEGEGYGEIGPQFALGDTLTELVNHKAAIVAQVRNTQPLLVRGVTARAVVIQQSTGEPVIQQTQEHVDMAPNSVFPLTLLDQEGYGFAAGEYTIQVELDHEEESWSFTQDFTITQETAQAMEEQAVNQFQGGAPNTPSTVILYVGLACLLLGILCVVHFVRRNGRA